jgi:hypothetical protein
MTNTLRSFYVIAALAGAMSCAAVSQAAFHQWEIKEVFTNADGTVQFVEFFTTEPGEGFLNTHNLIVTSDGVAKEFVLNHNLTNPTTDKHFLIATAGFAALAGGVAPDYSPLPANFFNPNAATIFFDFAHTFDTLTLTGSQIPKDGINSLTDTDLLPESGVDNMVVGVNSPTNFAGATGSVNLGGATPIVGDFTGDGVVNGADLTRWRTHFGAAGSATVSQGNADADGDVDGQDFLIWQRRVGATSIVAVPEPTAVSLAFVASVVAIGVAARNRRRFRFMPKP